MELIKDKNKIRWNETGKLITETTLEEIWQTLSKIYDLKGLQNRHLVAFLKVRLFVENIREGKKQYSSKAKGLII